MTGTVIISYALYSLFLFYQQLHIKNFRGASQGFLLMLNVFAIVTMLGGIAYLIYYGFKVSWLGALGLVGIAFFIKFVWFGIEAKLGLRDAAPFISIMGFIAIPICAFFMLKDSRLNAAPTKRLRGTGLIVRLFRKYVVLENENFYLRFRGQNARPLSFPLAD